MRTRRFNRTVGLLLAGGLAFMLSPADAKKARPKPGFEATLPLPPAQPPMVADGAIFQASSGYAALHEGNRARAVGDLLTVVLVERITSSKSATSKTARDGGFSITPPTAGPLDFLNPNALKASGGSSFNGNGAAAQQSALGGEVSVTIAKLLGNGSAIVKGQKRLTLSQGEEWVQFSGIVRLADIDQMNRIASTRVADAQIEYSGNGQVARASREGWLQRFFNMISPF
ncbi:flagellar basal body L-ring protein FlgH [Sphingomonas colocasiae]|uniref:Flagellar L-ring protein n=1 Tax=Sphingomonas colocasiae TaxID=1848973 RepID=A0ABS7PSY3_9SPHN|nr:flagellar basal body L-ring protein FlgH [Sphingomonas colocasiae]MBY8824457.1 flagellar basal body L-ring protein FlgH [Sphingomonas colocasiae]